MWAYSVEGQVFDREGQPLAGIRVEVHEMTTSLSLPGLERQGKQRLLATGHTDGQGFFRLDLGSGPFHGRVLLECGSPDNWDRVRYAPPAPRDITRDLRRSSRAVQTVLVEDASGWAELVASIARAGGPETKRGKILRRYGHPRETVTLEDGRVEWRYPNVTYVFQGDTLVESRHRDHPLKVSSAKETS